MMPPEPVRPKQAEPEDIFSGVSPVKNMPPLPGTPESRAVSESPAKGFARKMARLLVFAAAAAAIVAGGFYAYGFLLKPKAAPVAGNGNSNSDANANAGTVILPSPNPGANAPSAPSPEANVNGPQQPAQSPSAGNQPPAVLLPPQDDPNSTVDSDGDGLTDYQEVHDYHTDPHKADTDGDGLTDGEEVKVWRTDPLKADTDGDGFSDGQEVKNGYNPLGAGKLLPPVTK